MAPLKGSATEKNLLTAFAGESQARNRYTYFASQAKKEGFVQIADIFEETANQEKEHAKRLFKLLEGGEVEPFVNLIEEADALLFGSPTINGDAVKPVWDLLSSLAVINLKGKLGGAFGSYGWSGEAVRMIEDRMRGLKMHIPREGLRVKLIPTEEELEECRSFGRHIAEVLMGRHQGNSVIEFADLV